MHLLTMVKALPPDQISPVLFMLFKLKEANEMLGPKERERSLESTAKIEPGLAMSSKAKKCGHSPFVKEYVPLLRYTALIQPRTLREFRSP